VSQVKQAKRVPVDSAKVEAVFGRKGLGAADGLVDIDVAVTAIGAGEDRISDATALRWGRRQT
jgi:hypothetical protein